MENPDAYYEYNSEAQQRILQQKPWARHIEYFKRIHISMLALMKMVQHANSGGDLEVMGLIQGKIEEDAFIVTDVFALPVQGTETRVNAHAEAYEYMVEYVRLAKLAGRQENVVGWYHSHPGYGCWLSGIDVQTQRYHQHFQEPFVAIVIDPKKIQATGKVEIGAFRTFPSGQLREDNKRYLLNTTALTTQLTEGKLKDFGAHHEQYYSLEVSYFTSTLDETLVKDLLTDRWTDVMEETDKLITHSSSLQRWAHSKEDTVAQKDPLEEVTKQAHWIAEEILQNAVFFKEQDGLLNLS
jgi:COP9 signalosome complex subunit 5